VAAQVDQLGLAISQTLNSPDQAARLQQVYTESQKLDFNGDFKIEPATDGFVDLYDFALKASGRYTDSAVVAAAQALTTSLQSAIVAEAHRSGFPWVLPDRTWDLDNVHGLSIFLPLGEDLELSIEVTATSPISPEVVITRNLRLRDTYTDDQLEFVRNTHWAQLITAYYAITASKPPTATLPGPQSGLLPPDVTPPRTLITFTGAITAGQMITVSWVTSDTETGVRQVDLLWKPAGQDWTTVMTQTGEAGVWSFIWPHGGREGLGVRAIDGAGNIEPFRLSSNTVLLDVWARVYLPAVWR
jgi:hypothetical protein